MIQTIKFLNSTATRAIAVYFLVAALLVVVFSAFVRENQLEPITDNALLTSLLAVRPMLVEFDQYTQIPSDPVLPELFVRTEPTGAHVFIDGADKGVRKNGRLVVSERPIQIRPDETTVLDFA